jgi:uncharacterized membrane protein
MLQLILGMVIFLAAHSVAIVAPGWRDAMVARLGLWPWKGLHALVSLAGFVLIVIGYGAARQHPVALWVPPSWGRHAAMLLMLPVFPLLLAAYSPGRIKTLARHPMLVAVKLWCVAHLLANGMLADAVLFGGFLAWAVVDRISLKGRPVAASAAALVSGRNDLFVIVGGLLVYIEFIVVAHKWLIGVSPGG